MLLIHSAGSVACSESYLLECASAQVRSVSEISSPPPSRVFQHDVPASVKPWLGDSNFRSKVKGVKRPALRSDARLAMLQFRGLMGAMYLLSHFLSSWSLNFLGRPFSSKKVQGPKTVWTFLDLSSQEASCPAEVVFRPLIALCD